MPRVPYTTLNERQQTMLNALIQDERRSLRELMDLCNISSTSVAAYNLRRLAELGYISLGQPGVARSIRVIGGEQSDCVGTPEAAAKVVARAKAWAHRDPVLAAAIRAYEAGRG